MENCICQFCQGIFKNLLSLRCHERLCKQNPNRVESNWVKRNKSVIPWNKGKTKETDERLRKISEQNKGQVSWLKGKHISEETRLKLKAHAGGYRRNCGKGKKGYYKGIWCDSSWELAFVIFNLEHDIKFERCWEKFEYTFNGQKKHYFPDFKMADGTYVEIKGYENELWEAKLKQFPNALKVLKHDEMLPYLTYVKEKYGENFIELYDK